MTKPNHLLALISTMAWFLKSTSSLSNTADRPPRVICLAKRSKMSPTMHQFLEDSHYFDDSTSQDSSSPDWVVKVSGTLEDAMFSLDSARDNQQMALVMDNALQNFSQESIQSLFQFAQKWTPVTPRILILRESHAMDVHIFNRCLELGADAVVSTPVELDRAIRVLWNIPVVSSSPKEVVAKNGRLKDDSKPASTTIRASDACVLQQRWARYQALLSVAGGKRTLRLEQHFSYTQRLDQQIQSLPFSLLQQQTSSRCASKHSDFIRIVHISDTHNRHRSVQVPEGDLFLHTGDICGNYGDSHDALVQQFQDFVEWLSECVCPKFQKVILLGGNHDVYLDAVKCSNASILEQAQTVLEEFLDSHANVAYLDDSGTTFCGLRIYGTPVSICRRETQRKRYVSNAFERTLQPRFASWQKIPPDTDILLTHLPPAGILSNSVDACPMLTNRVMEARPKLHAFGHVHTQFGVHFENDTLFMNASLERLLHVDKYGGGTPLVVDLPLRGPWGTTDTKSTT